MNPEIIEISIGLIQINSSYVCLKRNEEPYKDHIEFPGGKKKSNETPALCLTRELKEELDIDIKKFKLITSIKHNYINRLIIINVYKIYKYSGTIKSKERRDIIYFNHYESYKVLPTHFHILNLLKIPKLLKIISKEVLNKISYEGLNLFTHIRLRDVSYTFYKKHIKEKLLEFNFNGNLIIDYPHNINWADKYSGIHYKSCFIRNLNYQKKDSVLYSASCHNLKDIELCNERPFNFILLSPVLESHHDSSPLGWQGFSNLSKLSHKPTLALGGTSSRNEDLIACINNDGFGLSGIRFF